MLVVKDAMVLIHLAKISLLREACDFFRKVIIPPLIFREVVEEGKKRNYADAGIVSSLIDEKKILVKKLESNYLVKKANEFNIQGGEAETVALYWQEQADLIASDDENVRNKKHLLGLHLIGTPSIIHCLFKSKLIDLQKFKQSINDLRKIGWFNSVVFDKILWEAIK